MTSASASAAASASSAAATAASSTQSRDDDDIRPVYPQTHDPPEPAAEKYCDLMFEVAERKRQECCPATPFTSFRPTAECVRTLSYALRTKAVALEKSDLDACEAAVLAEAKQCDWGGTIPAACEDIVRGQVEDQAMCRSSLECKEGRYCAGLGVSRPGKCAGPRPDGARCGGGVDPLGSFIVQQVEGKHAQCEGYCDRRMCAALVPVGGKCASSIQCGPGKTCRADKCTDAALPKAGESCANIVCAQGHRCSGGTCVVEKRIGQECKSDGECRSQACEVAGEKKGQCVMSCQIIRPAPSGAARGAPLKLPK